MKQRQTVGVIIISCPHCREEFYLLEGATLTYCPHCGHYFVDDPEYREGEINIYIDPRDGEFSAEADWV